MRLPYRLLRDRKVIPVREVAFGARSTGRQGHARPHLPGAGPRGLRAVWRLRRGAEAPLMLEVLIWGAGALVIGGYMLAALIRPEKF
jgi:hypothetical protein